jgi:catechol 2,3-dioxygenase-like lactoylglutathione lyase family enzyme
MKLNKINHVCLVVRDLKRAKEFYIKVLGLTQHKRVDSWLHMTPGAALHLVEIPEAGVDKTLYHEVQHFAVEVSSRTEAAQTLLKKGHKPFQMDFEGKVKTITKPNSALDFGIGTVFCNDPDGNLVEFIEIGTGVYKE